MNRIRNAETDLADRDGAPPRVVAAVSDGRAAVDAAAVLRPDLVVFDISMPVMSGLAAAAHLAASDHPPRIVFLTVQDDPAFVDAARTVGALGYVIKRHIGTDLWRPSIWPSKGAHSSRRRPSSRPHTPPAADALAVTVERVPHQAVRRAGARTGASNRNASSLTRTPIRVPDPGAV